MDHERRLYALRSLAGHLHHAGDGERLRRLLGSYSFLEEKVGSLPPSELVSDYEFLPEDSALRLVQSAVRLSSHVLENDPTQLPGHLHGRLLGHRDDQGEIASLLEDVRSRSIHRLIPMTASLTRAGGPLLQTLAREVRNEAIALMADGERVVAASWDRTLRVWSLATGQVLQVLQGHRREVVALALLPDGRRGVSGSRDLTLRLWDLDKGVQEGEITTASTVRALAVAPRRDWAAAGLDSGAIEIVSLAGPGIDTERLLLGHEKPVRCLVVTPDGRLLLSGSEDRTVKIWDLTSGRMVASFDFGAQVWSLAITPLGDRVLVGSWDGKIRVLRLEDRQEIGVLEGHRRAVSTLTVTRDGRRLVSGSADDSLRVWDLAEGRELSLLRIPGIETLVLTLDETRAVISQGSRLTVWDLVTPPPAEVLTSYARGIRGLALIPDGRFVVSASTDRTLKVWETASGQEIRRLTGHTNAVQAVAVTPDGRHAVSGSFDQTLRVWDLQTGETVRTLSGHTSGVMAVSLTADGAVAISGGIHLDVKIWSLAEGREVGSRRGHSGYLTTLAATPDGRLAVIGFQDEGDESPVVLDLATGRVLGTLRGHDGAVETSLIIPGTEQVLTGGYDATIRIWDLASRRELRCIEGHEGRILCLAVTPDGRLLVSGSDDTTLRVWRLGTGSCLAIFAGDGPIAACAISPDARLVIAGETSGALHFFRTEGLLYEPLPKVSSNSAT